MANKHPVVRTDLMAGTRVESELRSVRYYDATGAVAELENATVLKLDGLEVVDGVVAREVWKGVTPAADTDLTEIVLICTPEVMYDERLSLLEDFINEAGKPARGMKLHKNDIFSVTTDALDGTAAKGNVVELQADVRMNAVASATSATKVGDIIAIETAGRREYAVIQVG